MKYIVIFPLLTILCWTLSGCDTNNQVEFRGDRVSNSSPKVPVAKQLAQTSGGGFRRMTSSGYKVDFSFGAPVSFIQRTTASGHKAQLNISGQAAN
jgi:hypothetical protein